MMAFSSNQVNDGGGQVVSSHVDLTGVQNALVRGYVFKGGVTLGKSTGISLRKNEVTGGGIVINEGLVDPDISYNNLHDIGTTGIFADNGKNPVGLTIVGNQFDKVWEPMHLQWVGGPKFIARCKVLYNVMRGVTRHGIECQGDPGGDPNTPPGASLIVAYNWIDDWVAAAYHIALSIATGGTGQFNDRCRGVKVLSNVVGGNNLRLPGFPDWNFCALEAFGDDTEVAGNFMSGFGVGIYYNWNTPAMSIHDNTGVGLGHMIAGEGSGKPIAPAAANVYGNSWLPAGTRPTPDPPPVPADLGGAAVTPTPTPTQPPTPVPPSMTTLTVTATAPGTLAISGIPASAATLHRKSSNGPDPLAQVAGYVAGAPTFIDVGPDPASGVKMLSPQWKYSFVARDASGVTVAQGSGQVSADPLPTTTTTATAQPTVTVTVTTTAIATPTVAHTITTMTDGSIKVDGQ